MSVKPEVNATQKVYENAHFVTSNTLEVMTCLIDSLIHNIFSYWESAFTKNFNFNLTDFRNFDEIVLSRIFTKPLQLGSEICNIIGWRFPLASHLSLKFKNIDLQ